MTQASIARHKTAIGRAGLSKPFRTALEANLMGPQTTVFDYGCGRGDDLRNLAGLGFSVSGWDPVHQPDGKLTPADVVNLGYVINVIENPTERASVVQAAWGLTRRVLIVAARLQHEMKEDKLEVFGDGFLTGLKTFQKFFSQLELRDWVEQVLGHRAYAAAPGIFLIFRDEQLCQQYVESRYRRHRSAPTPRVSDILFQQHQDILSPLMDFVANRGRLPVAVELPVYNALAEAFGSVRKAFAVVRRVTGTDRWDTLRQERSDELLIHFALDRFGGRARFSDLPFDLQLDVREFFSTYNSVCESADQLLFRSGNMKALNEAIVNSPVGKLTGNALYLHVDALPSLSPLLKVYEGCARSYLGHVEGANIVKLKRFEPKVSYLLYPEFDTDPHPILLESLRLNLGNRDVKHLDFRQSNNPPILHRKEDFLAPDDPRRERFIRLTRQEEKYGLFRDTTRIGTRQGWDMALAEARVRLRGHRLIRAGRNAE